MTQEITHWYDIQLRYYDAKQRQNTLKEAAKQSLWEYRRAQQAETEYGSSLRHLLDRLRGNRERHEALLRNIRTAKARMEAAQRELKDQERELDTLEKQRRPLPDREEMKARAETEPNNYRLWAKLECSLCAHLLKPLLTETLEGLEACRQQLRGGNMDRMMSHQELHEIVTAHIAPAQESYLLLQRLKTAMEILEESLEFGSYFENPPALIESAAARHNRLDKVNMAIAQAETVQNRIAKMEIQ